MSLPFNIPLSVWVPCSVSFHWLPYCYWSLSFVSGSLFWSHSFSWAFCNVLQLTFLCGLCVSFCLACFAYASARFFLLSVSHYVFLRTVLFKTSVARLCSRACSRLSISVVPAWVASASLKHHYLPSQVHSVGFPLSTLWPLSCSVRRSPCVRLFKVWCRRIRRLRLFLSKTMLYGYLFLSFGCLTVDRSYLFLSLAVVFA